MRNKSVIVVSMFLVAACAPRIDYHGYAFDATKLTEVKNQFKTGTMTQAQVTEILGTPSAVATFPKHNDIWYYISKETSTEAVFAPKTVAQRVVAIQFDDHGKVVSIKDYGLQDARSIEPDSNATPTRGRKLTIIEQLMGNLGRFNGNSGAGK